MIFEESVASENAGRFFGFLFGYFLFTTAAYFIFVHLKNVLGWSYLGIMSLTLAIAIAGALAKRLLK